MGTTANEQYKPKLGVHRELRDQYIAACNGRPPWLTQAFVHSLCDIEYHDDVSSMMCGDNFRDKHTQEWTKQALKTLDEAAESYWVEVIAKSHFRSSN